MNVIKKPSNNQNKKITAIIDDKKTIHFGDSRYQAFTKHKDPERKKAYLARHMHDNYTDPLYPSFYATNLLWNKPTLKESIVDTNKNIRI